jgi:hypothetical protein
VVLRVHLPVDLGEEDILIAGARNQAEVCVQGQQIGVVEVIGQGNRISK